jgi:hypothetical protein
MFETIFLITRTTKRKQTNFDTENIDTANIDTANIDQNIPSKKVCKEKVIELDPILIEFQNLIKKLPSYIKNRTMIQDSEKKLLEINPNTGLRNKRSKPYSNSDFDSKFDANKYWNDFFDSL